MSNDHLMILDVSGWLAPAILGASSGAVNADGVPIEGPTKFFARIFDLLDVVNPSYFIVACDASRDTLLRREWHPPYKSNRPEKDPSVEQQFKLCYRVMKDLGFPLVKIARWEADDVMASYAAQFNPTMDRTTLVSADKDAHQLLDLENVEILQPDGRRLTREDVEKKWGVPVNKIRHVQALAGDSTDKIPGAQGIGIKKAVPLILKYGTVKKVKLAAEELTKGAKLSMQSYDPDLNLRLVTLKRDLDLPEEIPPWTPPAKIRQQLRNFGLFAG